MILYHKLPIDKQFEIFENILPGIQNKIEIYITMFKLTTGKDISCKLKYVNKKHKTKIYKLLLRFKNKTIFALCYEIKNNKIYCKYKSFISNTLIVGSNKITNIFKLDDLDYPLEYLINHI